jgi:DNA-binding protein H-NS
MKKSYAQVLQQIEALQAEAEALRRKEVEGVIARIREAIQIFGLTAADLGFEVAPAPRAGEANAGSQPSGAPPAENRGLPRRKSASRAERQVRYRDAVGNTWGGRGPRPRWVRNALASGKTLDDLAA